MRLAFCLAIVSVALGFIGVPSGSQPTPPVALDAGIGGTGGREAGLPPVPPPTDAGRRD